MIHLGKRLRKKKVSTIVPLILCDLCCFQLFLDAEEVEAEDVVVEEEEDEGEEGGDKVNNLSTLHHHPTHLYSVNNNIENSFD